MVGQVAVGGDAPIAIQSMTNTLTSDVEATSSQVSALAVAGADIVRVSCPDEDSTAALRKIVYESPVPLVADIHFHYRRAIEAAEAGASCLRINPGNVGSSDRVREVVKAARDHGCSMRIGVNAGSLERDLLEKFGGVTPEAMVESALGHARILEDNDFLDFKISVKASGVALATAAYRMLAEQCDYPLHLGITEARRPCHRHRQVIGRDRHVACRGNRRHDQGVACRRSGRGSGRRLGDPEGAGPATSRRQCHRVPVVRPPAVQRAGDGQAP